MQGSSPDKKNSYDYLLIIIVIVLLALACTLFFLVYVE